MSLRWTLLPAAMVALPFLVNACINEPTAGGVGSRLSAARLVAVDPVSLKLDPIAGNFPPPDSLRQSANGPYSQAQWTNKLALDGKFSVLLAQSLDSSSCYTATPHNDSASFAAVIVPGVVG